MVSVRGSRMGVVAAVQWAGHEQCVPVPQFPHWHEVKDCVSGQWQLQRWVQLHAPKFMYYRRFHDEYVTYELM